MILPSFRRFVSRRRLWIAALIGAGALIALAPRAIAHTALVSTDPQDGAILAEPPVVVTLAFDEELLPGANNLAINLQDGTTVVSVPAEPTGRQVSIPWPDELGPGSYQVAYRVVSADGHPVAGAIWFTIGGPESIVAAQSRAASPVPVLTSVPAASAGPGSGQTGAPSSTTALALIVGGLAAAILAGISVPLRRRSRP